MARSKQSKKQTSMTRQGLDAAIAILRRAKNPLSLKEIDERAVKCGTDLGADASGVRRMPYIILAAVQAERDLGGWRIVRAERGRYTATKV